MKVAVIGKSDQLLNFQVPPKWRYPDTIKNCQFCQIKTTPWLCLNHFCCRKNKKNLQKKSKKVSAGSKIGTWVAHFIKAAIAKIEFECNKNTNGEPTYPVQQIKHYLRENQYIVDHCFSSGIDTQMIDSYLRKMRMLPMESLMIIWCSIFVKLYISPYGWHSWSIAMTS